MQFDSIHPFFRTSLVDLHRYSCCNSVLLGPGLRKKGIQGKPCQVELIIIAREYISNANPTINLYISDKWVKTSYMSVEDSIIAPCIIQTFQNYLTPVYFHTKG